MLDQIGGMISAVVVSLGPLGWFAVAICGYLAFNWLSDVAWSRARHRLRALRRARRPKLPPLPSTTLRSADDATDRIRAAVVAFNAAAREAMQLGLVVELYAQTGARPGVKPAAPRLSVEILERR